MILRRRPILALAVVLTFCFAACSPGDPSEIDDPIDDDPIELDEEIADLSFTAAPPETATAGEPFVVVVATTNRAGEPVAGEPTEITVRLNRLSFADGTREATATTDAAGHATFELSLTAADEGYALTASASGEALSQVARVSPFFDVQPADPDPARSSITGTDSVANGHSESIVTIRLRDAFENPIAGVTPQFEASGQGNSYHPCDPTDADGISTCAMTTTYAEEKTLSLTAPIALIGGTVTFIRFDCDATESPFGGGIGTFEDPYRICTAEHLVALVETPDVFDAAFVVTEDLELTRDEWVPIGSEETPFEGSLRGYGATISGLTISGAGDDRGLFGVIGEEGEVRDLHLTGVAVHVDGDRVGGLAGTHRGRIEGVTVEGEVSGSDEVGLIAGANYGTIEHCAAEGSVAGDTAIGGLVGRSYDGAIRHASNASEVRGRNYAGGLVGEARGTIIERGHASGPVSLVYDLDWGFAGGLLGRASESTTITECSATGAVDGADRTAAGLVGILAWSTISRSFATGSVDSAMAGGLVGIVVGETAIVTDSFATGSVTAYEGGGFAIYQSEGSWIQRSYSAGSVVAQEPYGFSLGYFDHTEGFWDVETSGVELGGDMGGTPLTTAEFGQQETFVGWDFDEVWTLGTAPDGHVRPVLRWQP